MDFSPTQLAIQEQMLDQKNARPLSDYPQIAKQAMEYRYDPTEVGKYKYQEKMLRMMQDDMVKRMELETNPKYLVNPSHTQRVSYNEKENRFDVENIPPEKMLRSTKAFSAAMNSNDDIIPQAWSRKINEAIARNATTEKIELNIVDGEFT